MGDAASQPPDFYEPINQSLLIISNISNDFRAVINR